MILGLDDAVGCAAFAWDVTINVLEIDLRSSVCANAHRSTRSPLSFSILAVNVVMCKGL